jgi:hypothetical protein
MAAEVAMKDYKKVDSDLKSQLESFNTEQLSKADTQEKVILPTAEGKSLFILDRTPSRLRPEYCVQFLKI